MNEILKLQQFDLQKEQQERFYSESLSNLKEQIK